MPQDRYFLDQAFNDQDVLTFQGKELHHMQVMRQKPQDSIEVVNGKGQLAKATVIDMQKKSALARVEEVQEELKNNQLVIAQGLCRLNKLDLIVEKGTELGVTDFWIFRASRSEKKELSVHQIERLQQISISALKQCGRLTLPKILFFSSLEKLPTLEGKNYFGDIRPNSPALHKLQKDASDALFCVGPEKGFSPEELSTLEKKRFISAHLNKNILRTETAAIAAVSILSNF